MKRSVPGLRFKKNPETLTIPTFLALEDEVYVHTFRRDFYPPVIHKLWGQALPINQSSRIQLLRMT